MNSSGGKFSFEAIEKILTTPNKWKNVQSALYLAFNAISETLKQHEAYIKELELELSNKPARHELISELSKKISMQDLNEKLSHNSSVIDAKLIMLEDKPSLSDVQKLLSDKVKYEEVKKWMEGKASVKDLDTEVNAVYSQIDKVYKEISGSLSRVTSTKEIESIFQEVKLKPSVAVIEEMIDRKIEGVVKLVKGKADRAELLKKVDNNDIKSIVGILENKANLDSVEKLAMKVEKFEKNDAHFKKRAEKQIKESIEEIKQITLNEIDVRISRHMHEVEKFMNEINKELKHLRERPQGSSAEIEYLKEKLNENSNWFQQEMDEIKDSMQSLIETCKNEMSLEKANIRDIAAQKSDTSATMINNLEKQIKAINKEISSLNSYFPRIQTIEEQLSQLNSGKIKELTTASVGIYNDVQSLKHLLSEKADSADVERLIHDKNKQVTVSLTEIHEDLKTKLKSIQIESLKKSQEMFIHYFEEKSIEKTLRAKADKKEIDFIVNEIKELKSLYEQKYYTMSNLHERSLKDLSIDYTERINSIIIELRDKTWSADIVKLIDSKASIEETNQALQSIHSEIDEKTSNSDFEKFTSENSIILNTLCAEICVGRWLWKSGSLKDKFVLWDEENTNTNPILFVWEPKKSFVLVEEAGIFEISFAVFCKAIVEVVVNGVKVCMAESGKDCENQGVSKIEYAILPARSRVALKFNGNSGQGFLSLRKL